jgi:hypothetical protein
VNASQDLFVTFIISLLIIFSQENFSRVQRKGNSIGNKSHSSVFEINEVALAEIVANKVVSALLVVL